MKPIKMFAIVALAALMVMALVGTSSALAETTALCNTDPGVGVHEVCPTDHSFAHVHEVTSSKSKLLTVFLTVECDVLFLGDVTSVNYSGAPLTITGNFTYTNCGSCTATETSENAEIEVLKSGHELASITGEGQVHVVCGKSLDCEYKGEGLIGHGLGPLLAEGENANGETRLEGQEIKKIAGGFLCPKTSKLDILTNPLIATYFTSGGGGGEAAMECELQAGGKYYHRFNAEKCDQSRYELIKHPSEILLCKLSATGLLTILIDESRCDLNQDVTTAQRYELKPGTGTPVES